MNRLTKRLTTIKNKTLEWKSVIITVVLVVGFGVIVGGLVFGAVILGLCLAEGLLVWVMGNERDRR